MSCNILQHFFYYKLRARDENTNKYIFYNFKILNLKDIQKICEN